MGVKNSQRKGNKMNTTIEKIKYLKNKKRLSIRGNKHDIKFFRGYSYSCYRYVAVNLELTDIWVSEETGNFLPINCHYAIITKNITAEELIQKLAEQHETYQNFKA